MKKIAVLLPVVILALLYSRPIYYGSYAAAGLRGKASLAFGVCIMFLVMIIGVYKKNRRPFYRDSYNQVFLFMYLWY